MHHAPYIVVCIISYTVSHKKVAFVAITLPNANQFSKFFHCQKEDEIGNKKCKNLHWKIIYFPHTLNVLPHYVVKCKHSKMTQIVQKLQ